MEVNVGLGTDALTGPGVAACEAAGSGVVGCGLGEPVAAAEFVAGVECGEWLRVTCAATFLPTGKHPASVTATATVTPIATNLRLHVELVAASALPRFSRSNMIPPQPNPSRGTGSPAALLLARESLPYVSSASSRGLTTSRSANTRAGTRHARSIENMISVRAVVFDLDGTLFDHVASARFGLQSWLSDSGVELTGELEAAWFAAEDAHSES